MRTSLAFKLDILPSDDGRFIGLNLGADYCEEHECGIDSLYKYLGVSNDPMTMVIERQKISQNDILFVEGKKYVVMAGKCYKHHLSNTNNTIELKELDKMVESPRSSKKNQN